jgi:hypothetical protein
METKIEHRCMTEEERLYTLLKVVDLMDEGREDESTILFKTIPLRPYMAKAIKEIYWADFLVSSDYNLLEAEKVYGKNWLYK